MFSLEVESHIAGRQHPRGGRMNKKGRDYNEIELAMTRIGLFIIPLAAERECVCVCV